MPFSDYPTTQEKTIPYKLIAIVGGGIVLALIIIGVVFRFVNRDTGATVAGLQKQAITTALERCDQDTNAASCKRAVIDQAAASSATDLCPALNGSEADACLSKFARETLDAKLCDAIKNDRTKRSCEDGAYFAIATSSKTASDCDKIESTLLKKSCVLNLEPTLTSENCTSLGRSPSQCAALSVTEQAVAKQDPELCVVLTQGEERRVCESAVLFNDPDFDGLDTTLEAFYGSDPRKDDSDGDGFKDTDEVAAGYDPNGPGKLETQAP